MKRLRLQWIGILLLVAILPALPAAWTAQTLFSQLLDPLLETDLMAGAEAGLASTRDLLAHERAAFLGALRGGARVDTLSPTQWAGLTERERASFAARSAQAGAEAPPPRSGPVLLGPERMTLAGEERLVAYVAAADGARCWVTWPLPPALAERAAQLTDNLRLLRSLHHQRARLLHGLVATFVLVYGGILLFVLVLGLLLTARLNRPIAALAQGIERVAAGDLETRIETRGAGEVARLLERFNAMIARLQEQQQELVRLEKLAAWRQMARRLAHEIKNPLTPIRLAVQQMRDACPRGDPEYRALVNEGAGIVEEEVGALRNLVTAFSQFARLPETERVPLALEEIAADLTALYPQEQVRWVWDAGRDTARVQIDADREQVHRALINLVNNALEAQAACGSAGAIEVRAAAAPPTPEHPQGEVLLSVLDRGPGVAPHDRQRIFEPDYTTKPSGTGLGLAIVAATVARHGGRIAVTPRAGGGTALRISMPRSASGEKGDPA